jgi:aryl-alcohol dehydrogenase-like predicted oxidoreductase
LKIGLGTAQFGMDYGITNREGRTSLTEARRILSWAKDLGVEVLDTAPAYGCSEEVIGEVLPDRSHYRIVTKTPVWEPHVAHDRGVELVEAALLRSLRRLRQERVYGLLAHHAAQLLSDEADEIYARMLELKQRGLVEKIGVSVYSTEEIEGVLKHHEVDIVQLPVNVLDQRFIERGQLESLKRRGIEVHARSVFLQGVLLADISELPIFLSPLLEKMRSYHDALERKGLTPLQGAISFIKNIPEIDIMILGVVNVRQLVQVVEAYQSSVSLEYGAFSCTDTALLNPMNWPR